MRGSEPSTSVVQRPRATPAPAVLAALRAATAQRHERVDTAMPLSRPGTVTLQRYREHVGLLGVWLTPLHRWLAGFDDGPRAFVPGIAQQLRRIERDLAAIAATPATAIPALPARASAATRWGVAYVIEGSQLGAEFLHRRLAAALAPTPLHYLSGEDSGSGLRWRRFLQALAAAVGDDAAIRDCCTGAGLAFDRLLDLLAARGDEQ